MLMAGLDGIKNKLDPGPAMDKDLYDLPPAELKQIPTVCGSLREGLSRLDAPRTFLQAGRVREVVFGLSRGPENLFPVPPRIAPADPHSRAPSGAPFFQLCFRRQHV